MDIKESINDTRKGFEESFATGYLSFPIAKNNPGCEVTGLDIVNAALDANRARAAAECIYNLSFVSYEGIDFPFEADSFDLVVTRYAMHHFPQRSYQDRRADG